MFGLFKKKAKQLKTNDKVWTSNDGRGKGFITDLKNALDSDKKVIVLYFFKDTGVQLESLLKAKAIATEHPKLHLFNAKDADLSMSKSSKIADQMKENHELLCYEHYPTKSKEILVFEAIHNKALVHVTPCFYISLDDPIMKMFGSERIKVVMDRMGTGVDECIEHAMISKSIERAQKKLEESTLNAFDKPSQEEWFKTNVESY